MLALASIGCGGGATEASSVARIEIAPSYSVVEPGRRLQMAITAFTGSGGIVNPGPVTWRLFPSDFGGIDASGGLMLPAIGSVRVIANAAGLEAESRVLAMPMGTFSLVGVNGFSLPHTFSGVACPTRFGAVSGPLTVTGGSIVFRSDSLFDISIAMHQTCGQGGWGNTGGAGVIRAAGSTVTVGITYPVSGVSVLANEPSATQSEFLLKWLQSDFPFTLSLRFKKP